MGRMGKMGKMMVRPSIIPIFPILCPADAGQAGVGLNGYKKSGILESRRKFKPARD